MRSIGKVNIKKLKKIVADEIRVTKQYSGYIGEVTRGRIMDHVPESWYQIWESAHDEINCIVDDEILNYVHNVNR